eukprot:gene10832-biopygen4696
MDFYISTGEGGGDGAGPRHRDAPGERAGPRRALPVRERGRGARRAAPHGGLVADVDRAAGRVLVEQVHRHREAGARQRGARRLGDAQLPVPAAGGDLHRRERERGAPRAWLIFSRLPNNHF